VVEAIGCLQASNITGAVSLDCNVEYSIYTPLFWFYVFTIVLGIVLRNDHYYYFSYFDNSARVDALGSLRSKTPI
jgi:hypothetical protein